MLADASATPTGPGAAVYRGVAALTDRLGPERMTRVNDRVLRRLYPPERIEPVIAGGYYFAPTPAAWREVMTHCRPRCSRGHCPVLLLNGQFDQFRVGTRAYRARLPAAPGSRSSAGRGTWPTSTSRRPSPTPCCASPIRCCER